MPNAIPSKRAHLIHSNPNLIKKAISHISTYIHSKGKKQRQESFFSPMGAACPALPADLVSGIIDSYGTNPLHAGKEEPTSLEEELLPNAVKRLSKLNTIYVVYLK